MKTAKEREAEFMRDLSELLARHGAEIHVTDDGRPYGMHSGIAEVSMDSVWDGDAQVSEYAEFTLPNYMTADKSTSSA